MRLTNRTLDQIDSPITAAFALADQRTNQREMLDLSQAAPSYPPPQIVAERIAEVAHDADGSKYAPQPGIPRLREALAAELREAYGVSHERLVADDVLITPGCNQAFCLTVSALADRGDEIILPVPFYFNHDMWLRLDGLVPVHVDTRPSLQPDPSDIEAAITDRTRAIVAVTPGNPTGATISPARLGDIADLAVAKDIVLIVDETYRTFRPTTEPAHQLFTRSAWADNVVSLHSFSKEFSLPGYRVGAVVGHPDLLAEEMKLLDCLMICTPRIGQEAALAGLTHATDWRSEQVDRIRGRQGHFEAMMAERPGGFELLSSGAFFGWVRHPFGDLADIDVVRNLVLDHDVLVIPGSAFTPDDGGCIRMSFANLTLEQIDELGDRLRECGSSS